MKIIPLLLLATATISASYAAEPDDATKRKSVTSQYYVDTKVEEKQPIVSAKTGNYIVTYPTGGAANNGVIGQRHITQTLTVGNNGGDGVNAAGTDIPTVGAVNTGLNAKQEKLSDTAGRLVTYNGPNNGVTYTEVYNESGAYDNTTKQNLVRAAHVNAAVANAFGGMLTCSDWDTGHENNDDYCLIYTVNTNAANGTYVPHN